MTYYPLTMDGLRQAGLIAPDLTPVMGKATTSKVYVNGKIITFEAYNIGGNNYFKLRDLAMVISGSQKQFEVTWDGVKSAINLISGKAYTPEGTELRPGDGINKTAKPSKASLYKNGSKIELIAYTINGNNFFKLRDIGQLFDFSVVWDGVKKAIVVDTANRYEPE